MITPESCGIFAIVGIIVVFFFWPAFASENKKKNQWVVAFDIPAGDEKTRVWFGEFEYRFAIDKTTFLITSRFEQAARFDSFAEANEILNRMGAGWFAVRA